MSYAEKLRILRGNKTREQVANDLGISVSAYEKYEYGVRRPSDVLKVKIATYYKQTVASIFYDEGG